jgi:hypothetical protein
MELEKLIKQIESDPDNRSELEWVYYAAHTNNLVASDVFEQAAAELTAYRDLLTAIRETRHLGSFAIPAHVKAALELCEEQLAALTKEG